MKTPIVRINEKSYIGCKIWYDNGKVEEIIMIYINMTNYIHNTKMTTIAKMIMILMIVIMMGMPSTYA